MPALLKELDSNATFKSKRHSCLIEHSSQWFLNFFASRPPFCIKYRAYAPPQPAPLPLSLKILSNGKNFILSMFILFYCASIQI